VKGRPLRLQHPGAFYHVTSRGNERRDREKFLECLASATQRYGARIHAYALMTNHYHLLLETPQGNLSENITRPLRVRATSKSFVGRRARGRGYRRAGRAKGAEKPVRAVGKRIDGVEGAPGVDAGHRGA